MTASTDIQALMVILEEVRAIRQDNAEFKAEIKQDNAVFKSEIRHDLTALTSEISSLQTEIKALQLDIVGLRHDVSGLYHWDYWLLSIILVVFAMPQIVTGLKSLFGVIAEGISTIISAFRK